MEENVKTSAPGKLMLSGEWSVLEQGVPCIAMAVDTRLTAAVHKSNRYRLSAPDLGIRRLLGEYKDGKMVWLGTPGQNKGAGFAGHALAAALSYLEGTSVRVQPLGVTTHGKQLRVMLKNGKSVKGGFGSSAATCAAVSGAVLALHGHGVERRADKERVFKLAALAHHRAQGKSGSGYDLAASVWGGLLQYTRFDVAWLEKELASKSVYDVVEEKWPGFSAHPLRVPEEFRVAAGYSGRPASTRAFIQKLNTFKEGQPERYRDIVEEIASITKRLAEALEKGDTEGVLACVRENRTALQRLGTESGVALETKELAWLCDLAEEQGAAAKFSGAGGGDSAIAVCFEKETADNVRRAWKESGFHVWDAGLDPAGVIINSQ